MKTAQKLIHAIILILGLIVFASPLLGNDIPAEAYASVLVLWSLYMIATPVSVFKREFYTTC